MIGIVIVGHAPFATGLLGAAQMIFGDMKGIRALNLEHDTNLDTFTRDVGDAINAVDSGDGVIVLVDVLGGSPGNTVGYHIAGGADDRGSSQAQKVAAVTGANLPMLIETISSRPVSNLEELVAIVQTAGRDGVVDLGALLK